MSDREVALLGIEIEGKQFLLGSGSWGEVHKVKVEHDGVSLVRAAKRFFTMPSDISSFLIQRSRTQEYFTSIGGT